MEVHPLQQRPLRTSIKTLLCIQDQWRTDSNPGESPTVRGVNVWWIVVKIEHRNYDPTKT